MIPGPAVAARIFLALQAVAILFQLALAAGAPWGEYAMGGAFPGVFPPEMRLAALAQAGLLAGIGYIVARRAGLIRGRGPAPRWPAWLVVGFLGVGLVLNLITPSAMERLIWAPVLTVLFLMALRVAAAPPATSAPPG
ncbi:MAG: hypothetical protein JNK30_21180 [Phenylobacterium sp.]|uniref:hypothetical protein n=1 Tax=Phenylobacterium sp. TaxID=1871053 RepID=UPI001A5C0571|nr:hypothetical protein [Phenylobacterium sp.]MBL8773912.1 hypothetical protein [Phenylobacterium sp.]